jgi:hypothetical protein
MESSPGRDTRIGSMLHRVDNPDIRYRGAVNLAAVAQNDLYHPSGSSRRRKTESRRDRRSRSEGAL